MSELIPTDIIELIFSYIKKEECYRCGKIIDILSKKIKNEDNKYFCSDFCIDYQHY
jgi:hypothetical protein